jgi:hypothetical protein
VAVNGQQQISDQACQDLDHRAVGTASNQVVDFQVPFPLGKEIFDVPAQLVSLGGLFTGQIIAVGSDPVCYPLNLIADQSQRSLALIDTGVPNSTVASKKDNTFGRYNILRKNLLLGACLDPIDEHLSISLPLVKEPMTLAPAIGHSGIIFRQDFRNERSYGGSNDSSQKGGNSPFTFCRQILTRIGLIFGDFVEV